MCEPVSLSIASLALAATSATAGYIGQTQAANAQTAMALQVKQNAEQSFRAQQAAEAARFLQLQAQSSNEMQARTTEAAQARGRVLTAAAESGASGLNLDALVGDINRQLGLSTTALDYNRKVKANDLQMGLQNDYYQMVDRANSVPMGVRPSLLSPILSIAGAGLSSYAGYQQNQFQLNQITQQTNMTKAIMAKFGG